MVPMFFNLHPDRDLSELCGGIGDCWIPMLLTCLGVCVLRITWVIIAVPFNRTMITS